MARRALIVGAGVADRIAAGLSGWEIERTPGVESLDLVVWADYPTAACTPRRLTDLSLAEWDEACDRPLRAVIDLARATHEALAANHGTFVVLVPLMASAGGAEYTALA